jgi:hypothetical protein
MFFKRMKRHDVTTTPIHISYSLTVSRVIITTEQQYIKCTMAYSDIVTWCPMRTAMKGPERPWKALRFFRLNDLWAEIPAIGEIAQRWGWCSRSCTWWTLWVRDWNWNVKIPRLWTLWESCEDCGALWIRWKYWNLTPNCICEDWRSLFSSIYQEMSLH